MKKIAIYSIIFLALVIVFLLIWEIFGFLKMMITLFIFIILGMILYRLYKKYFTKSKEKVLFEKLNEQLLHQPYFQASQKFITPDFSYLLAIDENTDCICFIKHQIFEEKISRYKTEKIEKFFAKILSFNDLLQSEIIEDGKVITSTVRGSQIGSNLVSEMLADRTNNGIGSLTPMSSVEPEAKSIMLKLVVNDTSKPVYFIPFLNEKNPLSKSDGKYKTAMDQINHWHGIMSVLIKRADENSRNVNYFIGVQQRNVHRIN